jgi:hypothetical protein
MAETRNFTFEFGTQDAAGFKTASGPNAALRLIKGADDALTLYGNAEGFFTLARTLVLLAQPEAGRIGAEVRLETLSTAGGESIGLSLRRNDRVSEWPAMTGGGHQRVTDILREQGLMRMDDSFALLLKGVGPRPLAVYTVLKSKLGMPPEAVVRIGDNAPLVVKTYRDLVSAQADADEINRAGGTAVATYFK